MMPVNGAVARHATERRWLAVAIGCSTALVAPDGPLQVDEG